MKRRAPILTLGSLLVAGLLAAAVFAAQRPDYPKTRKLDHIDTYFGTAVADPYRWLEDDNSPETAAWVEEQNRLTFGYLGRIPYRQHVLERLRALANYPRYGAPERRGGYVFFAKNDGLQNQSVYYVQKGLKGKPEVLLDPNTFSADHTVALRSFSLSRDGRYAAYGVSAIPGSDWEEFRVVDVAARQPLPDRLKWVKFSGAAWRGDGFYYTRYPEPRKGEELTVLAANGAVYYHRLGTPQESDELVYQDPKHPLRGLGVATTEDERYALLYVEDHSSPGNALYYRDESSADHAFVPIIPEPGEDSWTVVDNARSDLFLRTDHEAPNGKVVRYDLGSNSWKTVLPEKPEPLARVTSAGGKLIATYLKDVTSSVQVFRRSGELVNAVDLPGPGAAGGFGGLDSDRDVFYTFSSFNYPPTIYRYDLRTRRSTLFRAPEIPGYRAEDFETKEVFYQSKDGTRVPMFLVYRKGLKLDGSNPTLLSGYGGFNITMSPGFSASRLAWLEQGGVFAQANLRGGGEYGEKWHRAGMRLNKRNVFDDCIAAAEWLIAQRYTAPGKLALQGVSNGGLLVGAVLNQRPDLFQAAVPQVGVMDMLRFQKFTAGAGWVSDYGSSDDPAQFKYLLGYSPLHNVHAGAKYPATLITTSNHDDRVVPAHSFKYAATLQERQGGNAPILIRIATNSGHGASNLAKALEETADIYSFLFYNLGVEPRFD